MGRPCSDHPRLTKHPNTPLWWNSRHFRFKPGGSARSVRVQIPRAAKRGLGGIADTRFFFASVVELVDTAGLNPAARQWRTGSTPVTRIPSLIPTAIGWSCRMAIRTQ